MHYHVYMDFKHCGNEDVFDFSSYGEMKKFFDLKKQDLPSEDFFDVPGSKMIKENLIIAFKKCFIYDEDSDKVNINPTLDEILEFINEDSRKLGKDEEDNYFYCYNDKGVMICYKD